MTVELRDLRWAIVASQHRSLRQAAEALKHSAIDTQSRLAGSRGQEFFDAARRIVAETEAITLASELAPDARAVD